MRGIGEERGKGGIEMGLWFRVMAKGLDKQGRTVKEETGEYGRVWEF